MRILHGVLPLLVLTMLAPAFGETQTVPTDIGTLDVRVTYDAIEPDEQKRIGIDFLNPATGNIQVHIDYSVEVTKDGLPVFGPIPLTHTSEGEVSIPIQFNQGVGDYLMDVRVVGILFQPIDDEIASFMIAVGEEEANGQTPAEPSGDVDIPDDASEPSENVGCLIATAAYGSDLAPQVQQLREFRDNVVMSTESGALFMTGFNQIYYSFAPTVAELQRENPAINEAVKVALYPLVSSLSLLNHAGIDSEGEMVGYGVSVIALNVGLYVGIPALAIHKIQRRLAPSKN